MRQRDNYVENHEYGVYIEIEIEESIMSSVYRHTYLSFFEFITIKNYLFIDDGLIIAHTSP